jgi:hypothetical protein
VILNSHIDSIRHSAVDATLETDLRIIEKFILASETTQNHIDVI